MPVEEFGGGPIKKTKPKRPDPVPLAPGGRSSRPPSGGYTPPRTLPSSGSSSSTKTPAKKSGSSTSSTAAKDPYAAAQAAAWAREDAAANRAADRYNRQAKNLEAQARALKSALNRDLKKGLLQQISDINQSRNQQGEVIREGFKERMKQLRGAARDNDKAQAQQSVINQLNTIRERNSALSEAMSQGAGESDTLNAMMMSLRNWNANASEVERGYFDTLRSIKSSQTDLEVDTKTALMNNQLQANADKEQLWTNYYNQRSELYTQLGNTRGQQADYYAMESEMRASAADAKKAAEKAKPADAKTTAKAKAGAKAGAKPAPKQPAKTGGGKAEAGKGGVRARAMSFREAQPVRENLDDFRVSTQVQPVDTGADERTGRGGRPSLPGIPDWVGGPGYKGDRKTGGKGGKKDDGRKQGGGKGGKKGPGPLQGPGNRKVTGVAKNAKAALKQSRKAFMQASKAAGRSWNNPGVSDAVMDWEGADPIKAQENNLNRLDTVTEAQLERKKPEGATLRRWS